MDELDQLFEDIDDRWSHLEHYYIEANKQVKTPSTGTQPTTDDDVIVPQSVQSTASKPTAGELLT